MTVLQYLKNVPSRGVPAFQPDDLRRVAIQQTALVEIGILRDDHKSIFLGVLPDRLIVGALHTEEAHLRRAGIKLRQRGHQTIRKILVEKELQARWLMSLCSRSAAN